MRVALKDAKRTLTLPSPRVTGRGVNRRLRRLPVEGGVEVDVVVEVDHAVAVGVAVEPAGLTVVEAGVRAHVIVKVDHTVEVRVAVVGELDEHSGVVDRLAVERCVGAPN